jgi:hypothetical protein
MCYAIPNNGVGKHSLFLATVDATTKAGLLVRITGCDAVDWNMMVRLNGSNVAAWQRSHQLSLLLLLDSCGRSSRPASQIILCIYFP